MPPSPANPSRPVSRETARGGQPAGAARFEEVPQSPDCSLGVFAFDKPAFERGWHYHPEAELTLILDGSGTRFVGDHMAAFGPGDLVLIGPNLPHTWRGGGKDGRSRSIYVHFRSDLFERQLGLLPELEGIRRLLRRAVRGLQVRGPVRDAAAARLACLEPLPPLERLLEFTAILERIARDETVVELSSPGFEPMLDEATSERIHRIHQHVFAHFTGEVSHTTLARLAGLSPSALSHFFKRNTGRTLTRFINEVRTGHAARLLIDTSLNVSEIAYACGFANLSHFNATFRQLKGTNPTAFRNDHLSVM